MALAGKPTLEAGPAGSSQEAAQVREQLGRLVAHPLFSNSKRYPALLAYTVEQTLLGNGGDLKERSIGIEVFGRSPSYDANADPVVRITAGEVRKRLMQYYYDTTHAGELVIELPTGSYVPLFRPVASQDEQSPVSAPAELPALPPPAAPATSRSRSPLRWAALAAALLVVGGAGAALGIWIRQVHDYQPPTSIDRFWEPITAGAQTATYCLGEPARDLNVGSINSFDTPVTSPKPEPLYFRLHQSGLFALADVITLTHTAAALESRHKSFRVIPASEATFTQLREGPFVLIGAFDNIWTLRFIGITPG